MNEQELRARQQHPTDIRQDTVTQPPMPPGQLSVPLPAGPTVIAPQGVTPDMAHYFNDLVDKKIAGAIQGIHIESAEQRAENYRRDLRNKVFLGAGAFVAGVTATVLWRKWRDSRDEDDRDERDMEDEDQR